MSVLSGDTIKKKIEEDGLIENSGLIVATKRIAEGENDYSSLAPTEMALREIKDKTRRILPGSADDYQDDGSEIIKIPYHEIVLNSIGPNGIDVRVSDDFQQIKETSIGCVDLYAPPEYVPMEPNEEGAFFIQPGKFCLASIVEYIQMPPDVMGQIDSRSSVGRRGLITQTATNIQAGWKGNLVLEIKNESPTPIKIYPYDALSQIVFYSLDVATTMPYDGKYQGQNRNTAPIL
jgi:dCTP deaminase